MGKKVTYLGLDIGNYDVKTVNTSTPSGFNVFTTKPYGVSEYLLYNGKYYTPSMDRFAYRKDKTKNENAFIMSLFGISKELIVRAQKKYDRELKRAEETSSYLPSVDSIQDVLSNNKNFITAGDRKTKYGEKIDLKKIRAFQLCLDLMDSFENLKYSHIPDNNMDLTFLANGKIYYVMNVSMAETFKINFAQQLYDKEVSSHISKKGVPVPYITIFLFSSTENEDDILEYFNSENIRIPCLVVISKSDGIQDKLVYDLYELNA